MGNKKAKKSLMIRKMIIEGMKEVGFVNDVALHPFEKKALICYMPDFL